MPDSNRHFEESELILNSDGSIFHLHLKPKDIAKDIILVGDPNRVKLISDKFDSVEIKVQNREFITHTGYFNNKRITVLSTGIGTDNIDIVLNELDALVNIDLEKRIPKEKHTALNLVRLGTTGALQKELEIDSFVISEFALGFDGLLHYYQFSPNLLEQELLEEFIKHSHWQTTPSMPYLVQSSTELQTKLGCDFIKGITATANGFYGPQGRQLRLKLALPNLNECLSDFRFRNLKITNFEMETSALYGLSSLLGHHACTICVIIANRMAKQYSKNYHLAVNKLADLVLERLTS